MVRYARANNFHKHKGDAAEATPWQRLSAGPSGANQEPVGDRATAAKNNRALTTEAQNGGSSDYTRGIQNGGSAVHKPNRKKKDYDDQDVNGFMEFLQQTGQPLPRGSRGELRESFQQSGLSLPTGSAAELQEELETALKKDRRREDRRIRRQDHKKSNMLCFHCRKPGHGLADCPSADADEETGTDICYRCGSTEHEITKCRARVDPALGEFPYAKCFICSQTGHLSRSCPDNPKGMYAQGGCCRICGSVEHFQRDCPEHQEETNQFTLPWLSNNMSADHEEVHVPVKKPKPKQTKVVKF